MMEKIDFLDILIALIAFLIGTIFGGGLCYHVVSSGIRQMDISQIANRAVGDVAAAYEAQLEKSGVTKKFQDCLSENARLKTRPFVSTLDCSKGECKP